ncbi:hypothetical protein LLG95_01830 [bacterium]|nr:hypothetical protein [bacterium]
MFVRSSIALSLFISLAATAFAGPGMIQYQGRLTDSAGNPITTAVNVTFTFWSAATGGSQLGGFSDTDSVTPNSQGLYSTMIGDDPGTKIPDAVFTSPQVWLDIQVGSEHLSPRKQMVATGYAFQSNWATTATASLDTLASVTGRGSSTTKELTLSGGVKTAKISPLSAGGSVQVENVYMVGGGIALPVIAPPASPANKIYFTSGTLYWNGTRVMLAKGENYMVVYATSDPAANGRNLISTYACAKALRPHGNDLTTTNRAVVVVPPGRYQLDQNKFVLDAEYVDLVGLTTDRQSQFIYGNLDASSAVLVRQAADDIRIENLFLDASCPTEQIIPPAAYDADASTTHTIIRNCEFSGRGKAFSMSIGASSAGYYENVKAGRGSFGYTTNAAGTYINCEAELFSFGSLGAASGSFTNCKAGHYSFGYKSPASGTFNRCTAGNYSFGHMNTAAGTFTDCIGAYGAFAYQGTASGKFFRCEGGGKSFAAEGTASGTFEHCTGSQYAFGYKGTANGTFTRCKAEANGFGYLGTAGGTFTDCAGGDWSFGSIGTAGGKFVNCTGTAFCFGFAGTASGAFVGCSADGYSFGTGDYNTAALASGSFTNCIGGGCCFGAGGGGSVITTMNGTFTNCIGGGHSFGGQYANNAGARLQGCTMNSTTWWGTWSGQMENCRWASDLNLSATARIYNSTFLATLNLVNTAAGVTQSRARSIVNDGNNLFGATNDAAMNIENANIQ